MPRKSAQVTELLKMVSCQNTLEFQLRMLEVAAKKAQKISNELQQAQKEKNETEKRIRLLANRLHVKLTK